MHHPKLKQQPFWWLKKWEAIQPGFQFDSENFWYMMQEQIASGAFGYVTAAEARPLWEDVQCPELVAIKFTTFDQPMTKTEIKVLQTAKKQGCQHFPIIYDHGHVNTPSFDFIAMRLLGPDLYRLQQERTLKKFSLGTALRAGIQTLEALRELHDKCGFVCRDIKPDNFVIGSPDVRNIYMVDFGLCKPFRDENNNLLPSRDGAGFPGTDRYASLQAHNRMDLAPKDDVEGWHYMLMEMTTGQLPWDSVETSVLIQEMKEDARTDEAFFKDCPSEFKKMLVHIDRLQFEDRPNYEWLTHKLEWILLKKNMPRNGPMDWEIDENEGAINGNETDTNGIPQGTQLRNDS